MSDFRETLERALRTDKRAVLIVILATVGWVAVVYFVANGGGIANVQ